jgi:hypothetical protein
MWLALIPIIAQYGLPLAERLWALAASKAEPTQADWDALKVLAAKSSADYLAEAQAKQAPKA